MLRAQRGILNSYRHRGSNNCPLPGDADSTLLSGMDRGYSKKSQRQILPECPVLNAASKPIATQCRKRVFSRILRRQILGNHALLGDVGKSLAW